MRTTLALIAATTLALTATPAQAGTFKQALCANAETGSGAGTSTVDGLTTPATVPTWRPPITEANCGASKMSPERALRLEPRADVRIGQGEYAALRYEVENPNLSLASARYWRAYRVLRHTNDSKTMVTQHGGSDPAAPAAPINERDWQVTIVEHNPRGRLDVPFSPENEIQAAHDGRGFSITAHCTGESCAHGAGDWTYYFFGGEAELHDGRAPTATATLTDTAKLTYTAEDHGGGLYRRRLWIDGVEQPPLVIPGGAACADANPKNTNPYEFTAQQPCATSTARTEQLDLAHLPSGAHRVRATIEDAAGNETLLADRAVTIHNDPPRPAQLAPALIAPSPEVTATPALKLAPSYPGARITLSVGPRRTTFKARPQARGRLVDAAGRPIAGQTIRLTGRDANPGAPARALTTTTTAPNGTFTTRLPGGASRTITAAFESARATAKLTVPAAISLTIGPAQVGRPTKLTGRLLHAPKPGIQIQIQALDGRRWRTFDTTKTRANGTYTYTYRFKPAARGRTFALRVLVDSPAYPFASAASSARRTRVR